MSAPVDFTCPDINKVLKVISEVERTMYNLGRSINHEGLEQAVHDAIRDVEVALWGTTDILEELRAANAKLRDWGESMEDREDEVDALKAQVIRLEDEVVRLKSEIDELDDELANANEMIERLTDEIEYLKEGN